MVPKSQCREMTGEEPIRGRWVDISKGDIEKRDYTSRDVAMEIRQLHGGNNCEGLFAATRPVEALKLLLSHTVSRVGLKNARGVHKVMFIDISKAYLHADVIYKHHYVQLPGETGLPDQCCNLLKALYGTRDGAKCWENGYSA